MDDNTGLILRSVIDDIVPEHVSHNYPGLMAAVKVYADFLEKINTSGHYLNTIDLQRDIDNVESELLSQLQKEIGAPIPRRFAADPRILYKRLSEFYRSRGTPESIETFFRILFNDDVEIYFPKDDMLIPSDGKWTDQEDDVIENAQTYTPTFTFTLSSSSDIITGDDDNGKKLIYDNPIIFVGTANDVGTQVEFTSSITVNNSTNSLDYTLELPETYDAGTVVRVFKNGTFSTNDGFISNYKKIQDSFFYQKFSYVLRTGTNTDEWKNAFTRLVHPSGFIFFGEILLFIEALNQSFPTIQPGKQVGGLPFPIIIPAVDGGASFVKIKNNYLASFIVKEFQFEHQDNAFGPNESFDMLKFNYTDDFNQLGHYTIDDVINNRVKENINSVIEIS